MSPNNTIILYAGLDVAKATLQFHLCGVSYALHHTPKDHARILRLLAEAEATARPGTRLQIVLEATEEEEGNREAGGWASRRLRSRAGGRAAQGAAAGERHPAGAGAAFRARPG